MAKNDTLYRGNSYTFRIAAKDVNGDPLNWDDVDNFVVCVYSIKSNKALKTFTKDDLTIDDPASGIATFTLSGTDTENAEEELYAVEYKYKTDEEKGRKGYLGKFVRMKLEKEHFITES
jgi:replication-associated recombination protein RarA